MKRRLLFVDDEPQILEGLQDALRKQRRSWDMTFACGGEAAIIELAERAFDVLVCDMRMPVVDGEDVLRFARQHHPSMTRIVLSGYSEIENTVRVTSLAHRYLTKPCDRAELEDVLTRAAALLDRFDDERVQRIAGSADLLPAGRGDSLQRLIDGDEEDLSVDAVADIVASDVAMTAKVLQLVNSAFFRRRRTLDSAREAVMYLGVDLIRSLVLSGQLFARRDDLAPTLAAAIDDACRRGLLTALLAKEILGDGADASLAFTAGLLHDVGELVIATGCPREHERLLERRAARPVANVTEDLVEEATVVGASHADVGACYLSFLGVPPPVIEAVAWHHLPSAISLGELDVVGAVHLAECLAHVRLDDGERVEDRLDPAWWASLDTAPDLDALGTRADELSADIDSLGTAFQLRNAA